MANDVNSFGQQGGITANTVNIKNRSGAKNSKASIFAIVVGICTVIGVAVTVWSYLEPRPKEANVNNNQPEGKTVNVTSYNQFGGITAGEVNVGALPRTFTKEGADKLESLLSEIKADKSNVIVITCSMGDAESYNFAEQIMKYLKDTGRTVKGINQALWTRPIKGVSISPRPKGEVAINVGNK